MNLTNRAPWGLIAFSTSVVSVVLAAFRSALEAREQPNRRDDKGRDVVTRTIPTIRPRSPKALHRSRVSTGRRAPAARITGLAGGIRRRGR